MAGRSVPLVRIFKSDYPSLLGIIVVLVSWGLAGWALYHGSVPTNDLRGTTPVSPRGARIALAISGVLTLIAVPLSLRRGRRIQHILSDGAQVPGTLTLVRLDGDRGRVEYTYEHGGRTYEAGNAIWRNPATERLSAGDAVSVYLDPEAPAEAYVGELYD